MYSSTGTSEESRLQSPLQTSVPDSQQRDYLEQLRVAPAFADLSESSLTALSRLARLRFFKKGREILKEGQPGRGFYLVLSGRVKMVRCLPNGRNLVLALFHPGDLFGAVSALGGQPCEATMVALDATSCLIIDRDGLFRLFEERPQLIGEILPIFAERLVECKNCIVELTCYRVEKRFAQLLLKFADSVGQSRSEGTFIPIPLSRQELADMTGTTIETCIRIMSRWAKQDVVETQKDGFTVLDRATLEGLAPD